MTRLNVTLELTDEVAQDIMTTAAEGGIDYWAWYKTERDDELNVTRILNLRDGEEYPNPADAYAAGKLYTCDKETIALGISRAFAKAEGEQNGRGWTALCQLILAELNGNGGSLDAGDCDTIVQLGVFNDVIYG